MRNLHAQRWNPHILMTSDEVCWLVIQKNMLKLHAENGLLPNGPYNLDEVSCDWYMSIYVNRIRKSEPDDSKKAHERASREEKKTFLNLVHRNFALINSIIIIMHSHLSFFIFN